MVCAALGRGQGPASEPRDAVLQTVLKGLEWHESLFAAAEAYFTVESFYGSKYREEVAAAGNARLLPESGPGAKKYLWRSDGRRWYCEETRLLPPAACVGGGHRKWAFDGNEHYNLDMSNMMGSKGTNLVGETLFTVHVFYFMLDWDGVPLSKFLGDGNTRLLGKEELDGDTCHRVAWAHPDSAGRTLTCWIAEDHGFAVKRMEYRSLWPKASTEGVGIMTTLTALEWRQPMTGLWVPTHVKKESYKLLPDGAYGWQLTEVFQVDDLRINPERRMDDYVVEFPVGTRLADEATGEIHMVGGDYPPETGRVRSRPPLTFEDAWSCD